jgi:hypothetical protein
MPLFFSADGIENSKPIAEGMDLLELALFSESIVGDMDVSPIELNKLKLPGMIIELNNYLEHRRGLKKQ